MHFALRRMCSDGLGIFFLVIKKVPGSWVKRRTSFFRKSVQEFSQALGFFQVGARVVK